MESFKRFCPTRSMSAYAYEWVRNYQGLMPLRRSCSTACWMSEHAWTEWKSYSQPRFNYVAWLPESTPFSVFKSKTLGTMSLFGSGVAQRETSTQVQKNVLQLRISRSLTCDDLNARLTLRSGSVKGPWSRSDFDFEDYPMSDKISWRFCGRGNGKALWTDDNSDPLRDVRDFAQRMREEHDDLYG